MYFGVPQNAFSRYPSIQYPPDPPSEVQGSSRLDQHKAGYPGTAPRAGEDYFESSVLLRAVLDAGDTFVGVEVPDTNSSVALLPLSSRSVVITVSRFFVLF